MSKILPKIHIKFEIAHDHPFNKWLPWINGGNQELPVMYLQISETVLNLLFLKHLEMQLKLRILFYHPLSEGLLSKESYHKMNPLGPSKFPSSFLNFPVVIGSIFNTRYPPGNSVK